MTKEIKKIMVYSFNGKLSKNRNKKKHTIAVLKILNTKEDTQYNSKYT